MVVVHFLLLLQFWVQGRSPAIPTQFFYDGAKHHHKKIANLIKLPISFQHPAFQIYHTRIPPSVFNNNCFNLTDILINIILT